MFVLCPSPADGVFDPKFNGHVLLTRRLSGMNEVVFLFWSHICVWVERFRVHSNKVGYTDDPVLNERISEPHSILPHWG